LRNNVSLSLLARNATEEGISATKVRELIKTSNTDELVNCVPSCVFNMRDSLKTYIEISELYGR
jgi:citrate lyase synthetase